MLPTQYCSGDKMEKEIGGECSMYGREERCIQSLEGKPQINRPLEKPRRTWEDNIKMDLEEVGWGRGLD